MVHINLTALAAASTFFNIIDFQGRAIELTNGDSSDYVPVQSAARTDNPNQQWQLIQEPGMISNQFFILNANGISYLSHPSAESTSGGTTLGQQAMAHTLVKTQWIVDSTVNGDGLNIIDVTTSKTLTSWAANPQALAASNPLTLQGLSLDSTAQTFLFASA